MLMCSQECQKKLFMCSYFSGLQDHDHVQLQYNPVESKTRTCNGRVGSGRTVGRRGGVRQDWTPTEHFAQETNVPRTLQGIEDTSPERLSRSTNKGNSISTDGGTQ